MKIASTLKLISAVVFLPFLLAIATILFITSVFAQGSWVTTGSMVEARTRHTATLLPNDKVLVAGGDDVFLGLIGPTAKASAELYDPVAGTFSPTGGMGTARTLHTATPLLDGRVLVIGGITDAPCPLASAEIYDPATGTFSATGSMTTGRYLHTATLLADGKVLVAGGFFSRFNCPGPFGLSSAEIYDPSTGNFSPTGSMAQPRFRHTATALLDGRVFLVGGTRADVGGGAPVPPAELYDPSTGSFSLTGSPAQQKERHTATLLPDGRVLVAGGGGFIGPMAELYDPATGTFSATGNMTVERSLHTATLLADGKVLVVGGHESPTTADLYDLSSGAFNTTGSMAQGREEHTATLLPNGKVLVAGGGIAGVAVHASAELYVLDAQDLCPTEDASGFDANADGCIDTIQGLIQIITTLPDGTLSDQLKTSLVSKVENAQKSSDKSNICAGVNQLQAFINEVDGQRGKKVSDEAANDLIAYAQSVIAALNSQLPAGETCK